MPDQEPQSSTIDPIDRIAQRVADEADSIERVLEKPGTFTQRPNQVVEHRHVYEPQPAGPPQFVVEIQLNGKAGAHSWKVRAEGQDLTAVETQAGQLAEAAAAKVEELIGNE